MWATDSQMVQKHYQIDRQRERKKRRRKGGREEGRKVREEQEERWGEGRREKVTKH